MNQILWFGPAGMRMMTHEQSVRLEVLADEGATLRIKVLDQPQCEPGFKPMLLQGEELRIANIYRSNGTDFPLLEFLETRSVAPWYKSTVDGDSIAGCMYARAPIVHHQ